jgi:hypothetical protein
MGSNPIIPKNNFFLEVMGFEPIFNTCKAFILPIKLYPPHTQINYKILGSAGFEPTTLLV